MIGRILLIVTLAGLAAGCEGGGPLTSRHSMMGSLKTSVSQLEYQNDELQRQVASLKAENRRFEDRLVQERTENESLANQLDVTRGRLGEGTGDIRTGSRSRSRADDEADDPASSRVHSSKSRRKPPAVAIPGRIEPSRVAPDDDDVSSTLPPARSRLASRRTLDDRWLPVARGTGSGQGALK